MTVQNIVSFDPGLITGIATGRFSDDTPLEVVDVLAVPYNEWVEDRLFFKAMVENRGSYDHVVSEVFTSRTDNEFAPDLTGVRVEGILNLAFSERVIWRPRTKKEQVPDAVLRDNGIWYTGEQVEWSDGRDVNDAIIHMLGFVAFDLRHRPTLEKYFRG